MFLSRMTLAHGAASKEIFWDLVGDAYRMHREAWRLLGAGPDAKRDFLYRLETTVQPPVLYALAPRPAKDTEGLWSVESRTFEPKLEPGDRLRFDVRVNPVVTRNGKRHDVVMDSKWARHRAGASTGAPSCAEIAQEAVGHWFCARGQSHGFRPGAFRVDGYQVRKIPRSGGRHPVRLAMCEIRGVLEIHDPGKFLKLVRHGLGPAKAFGCGLFLLRRA